MNQPLSVYELIANASLLVQGVMALLVLASVVSWMMILQRWSLLRRAKQEIDAFEDHFWSGIDLRGLYQDLSQEEQLNGIEEIFVDGFREYTRLSEQPGVDAEAIMQGAQRAMRVTLMREEARLETHLPFLATVGSTSPYIGLFGTVWGIMNSFRGLATVKQATLATVAPGISEALVATAIGLFAAIPAVIAYNRFNAKVDSLAMTYENFADEFAAILHRRVHQRGE